MFGYRNNVIKWQIIQYQYNMSNLVFVGDYTISAPNHSFSYGTEIPKFKPNPSHTHTSLQLEIKSKIFSEVKH